MDNNFLLYVEDDSSNRLVMKLLMDKILHTKNYMIFEDSANFMSRVRNLPARPTIFMLDIHIAPLNGFQLLHLLRQDSGYYDSKIIALTASVMNEEVKRLRESGFDGAISKPITLSTFPKVIDSILNGESVWQI